MMLFLSAVFERHYIDCNFLMTGQQVVIVTPGAGVFEVSIHNYKL